MKSEKAVSLIAIHAHGIPHVFPPDVLAEAEAAKPAPHVQPRGLARRCRSSPSIRPTPRTMTTRSTPSPTPTRPIPAASSSPSRSPTSPGTCAPAAALDREALKRGNSVYFPDRVVPMLPERISNDLCSLREDEDRPALAVRMVFSADGRKRSHRFHRIMMRSAAKLSYRRRRTPSTARAHRPRRPCQDRACRRSGRPTERSSRGRDEREPLDLDLPERKVILGKDGTIERIVVPERLEAHRLIEEFMIQANVAAAETLEAKKSPLVYRIHDAPSLAKLEALREFLASIELSLPKGGNLRPSHFNRILARADEFRARAARPRGGAAHAGQAEYSPENIGHFGLNLRRYAHFTSPIRRYADLIVHRALIRALKLGAGGLPDGIENELPEIAAQISAAERRAMAAERETIDRLVAHWLADRIGATFHGRISGVTRAGLFVKLDETGADGFVPMRTLGERLFRL